VRTRPGALRLLVVGCYGLLLVGLRLVDGILVFVSLFSIRPAVDRLVISSPLASSTVVGCPHMPLLLLASVLYVVESNAWTLKLAEANFVVECVPP